MSPDFQSDISWSSSLFLSSVWPRVMESGRFGELISMEGRPDTQLASLLDVRSGIDGWELTANGGIRGVASRIQIGNAWRSFTVRMTRDSGAETEYAKRKKAIHGNQGLIYPHLTVQAYADSKTGPVSCIGICRTADLIAYIDSGEHSLRRTSNASFAVCYWDQMTERNINVMIIENQNP